MKIDNRFRSFAYKVFIFDGLEWRTTNSYIFFVAFSLVKMHFVRFKDNLLRMSIHMFIRHKGRFT